MPNRLREKKAEDVMHAQRYETLFSPTSVGDVELTNSVALAQMTRVSATAEGLPTKQMGGYYRRFADGGFALLITEGLYVDHQASQGYLFQPGIADAAQAECWKRVVDGVHEAGAKIFAQL